MVDGASSRNGGDVPWLVVADIRGDTDFVTTPNHPMADVRAKDHLLRQKYAWNNLVQVRYNVYCICVYMCVCILVMQCFRVGYRGICHASLVFSVYTRAFRRVCIRRKYKWQVACSTVSHEKALHNYFIPCLNLQKTYRNFRKSSEISMNFRKHRKRFQPVFEELQQFMKLLENFGNSSKVFSRCLLWFFKTFGKSSEIFGSVRKSLEIFGKLRKRFNSNFQMLLLLFKIFGKSSKIFGSVRKSSQNNFMMWSEMFVMVRKSWKVSELAFEKSSNGPQWTVARKERRESRVEYSPLHITRCIPQNM